MANKYYAWSTIRHGDADGKTTVFKAGDEITEKSVGKEDFDALVESKAIRTIPFPNDIPATWQDSPMAWLREKIKRQAGDDELASLLVAGDSTLHEIEHSGTVLLPPAGLEPAEPTKPENK